MSWYIHPSKQLRDDELPPELVVTNRDGSIEQVYVPYNASDQLEVENVKLREELAKWERLAAGIDLHEYPVTQFKPKDLERENAELQDENARLRSCLSDDVENARMIMGENAKLRELVARMARALRIGGDWCDRDCLAEFGCTDSCSIADAMRELGIEVDG